MLAYAAWSEVHFREALLQEGIPAKAVLQICRTKPSGTKAKFEFEVINADGSTQRFYFYEHFPRSSCKRGQEFNIRYLPTDPYQAGVEGVDDVRNHVIFSIVGLIVFLLLCYTMISDYKKEGHFWIFRASP